MTDKIDADLEKRSENFHKDYKIISEKYKIDLAAVIQTSPNGIIPKIMLIDLNKENKNG